VSLVVDFDDGDACLGDVFGGQHFGSFVGDVGELRENRIPSDQDKLGQEVKKCLSQFSK
jgi:hypothetical protein